MMSTKNSIMRLFLLWVTMTILTKIYGCEGVDGEDCGHGGKNEISEKQNRIMHNQVKRDNDDDDGSSERTGEGRKGSGKDSDSNSSGKESTNDKKKSSVDKSQSDKDGKGSSSGPISSNSGTKDNEEVSSSTSNGSGIKTKGGKKKSDESDNESGGNENGNKDISKTEESNSTSKKESGKSSTEKDSSRKGQHEEVESSISGSKEKNDTDKYLCVKDGHWFKLGVFLDPIDNCSVCECCEPGFFTCTKRECPPPKCGRKLQTLSKYGCCMICGTTCKNVKCPKIDCAANRQAYGHYDCCPTCGCYYNEQAVLPGKFGHDCERCRCYVNGTVVCERPQCPSERQQCVDVTFTKDCQHTCPNEKTCRRGDKVIRYGQLVEHHDHYCTCHNHAWYTRGFCATKFLEDKKLQLLQKEMCVASATIPTFA